MSKNKFTGTATQLQRNRKFCQFNKDQYRTSCLSKQGVSKSVPFMTTNRLSKRVVAKSMHLLTTSRLLIKVSLKENAIADDHSSIKKGC